MALVVNSNLSALTAKTAMSRSEADMSVAMERLSTGKRINSAADDSAGMAIATRMDTQIRGFSQAIRNVNDGISMVQAVDGALGEINDALQRMRELAVQAVNGSNTSLDRIALQNEFATMAEQINMTAGSTRFNGMSLLNGSFVGREIQAGASVGETIGVGFQNARSDSLGMYYAQTGLGVNKTGLTTLNTLFFDNGNSLIQEKGASGSYDNGMVEAKLSIAVQGGLATDLSGTAGENEALIYIDAKAEASAIADQINASGVGLRAYAETQIQVKLASEEGTDTVDGTTNTDDVASVKFTIGSGQRTGAYTSFTLGSGLLEDDSDFAVALAAQVNATSNIHGITAEVDAEDGVTVRLTQSEGRDIKLHADMGTATQDATIEVVQKEIDGNKTAGDATDIVAATAADFGIVVAGQVTMYSGTEFTMEATSGAANFDSEVVNKISLGGANLTGTATAREAIALIDSAIEAVANQRAAAGSLQNRLTIATQGLAVAVENQSAAYSRIVDADFATESSNLAKNQILQQVSTAMLAQANAMPQVALSLIQ